MKLLFTLVVSFFSASAYASLATLDAYPEPRQMRCSPAEDPATVVLSAKFSDVITCVERKPREPSVTLNQVAPLFVTVGKVKYEAILIVSGSSAMSCEDVTDLVFTIRESLSERRMHFSGFRNSAKRVTFWRMTIPQLGGALCEGRKSEPN